MQRTNVNLEGNLWFYEENVFIFDFRMKINEINLLSPLPEVIIKKEEVEEVIEEVIIEKQEEDLKEAESKEEADESNKIVIDENSTDNQFKLEL